MATYDLDGLTSSTFRSKECHVGVLAEELGDICLLLIPEATRSRKRRDHTKSADVMMGNEG